MITVRTLGPVDVSVDSRAAPPELLWRKNIALLVYLARSPRRAREREHLLGLLWGDKPESAARHSLREAIRVLRQAGGAEVLETEGDQLHLAAGAVELDLERFDVLAAAHDWAGASELAVGDFLEGFAVADAPAFEDWLAAERATVRARLLAVLVSRAEELQHSGDLTGSADLGRRALALDPLSAAAVRVLMRALALHGERGEALAAYEVFAVRLRDEVGTEPDAVTQRLAEQIRREKVWREPRPGARGAESRRAPLVGRDAQLARLLELWQAARGGKASAALIEGDSGAGRTRLAEEIAARARLDGAASVQVRGTPADRQEPWSGVFGMARGGLLDAAGVSGASAGALGALAARLEEWADRFPAARGAQPLPTGAAFTDVVRAAAGEQPVLLVVDDAHWLDAESLVWLHGLARDLAGLPVLVVCTATPQPPRDELEWLRSRLGREIPGAVVALEPFGPDALATLARWAMPSYTPVQVDRLARRIAADSAGLPLLAVELLHAVALGLDLHSTPHAWPEPHRTLDQTMPGDLPETVVAAIRIGFRRLGKDAQAVLAAAAVLGGRVGAPRLGRASGLTAEALATALDEAEWQRWLTADARGYSCVARVARDVIARDMVTEGQRQRMLERAGAE